jgi:hypothetical protein
MYICVFLMGCNIYQPNKGDIVIKNAMTTPEEHFFE